MERVTVTNGYMRKDNGDMLWFTGSAFTPGTYIIRTEAEERERNEKIREVTKEAIVNLRLSFMTPGAEMKEAYHEMYEMYLQQFDKVLGSAL